MRFNGEIVFVQGDQLQAAQWRHLRVDRAVGFHRHRAEDAVERVGTAIADRVHRAGVVHRLGQVLQNQELLDRAARDAFHVAALVDVEDHDLPGGCAPG